MILNLMFLMMVFNKGAAMATEEPKYVVESRTEQYEIRKYNTILVAETRVDAEFKEAGNKAFRILADYIFGNNKSKRKIEMTAPVSQQSSSEKIEMTAPVSQVRTIGGFMVQFTMPDSFTLNTLPEPNDSRVQIREIPARKLAVYSYSGSWTESRYQEKLQEFVSSLKAKGVLMKGEPIFSRYNSPFTLWFLRRNEIWIEVVQ